MITNPCNVMTKIQIIFSNVSKLTILMPFLLPMQVTLSMEQPIQDEHGIFSYDHSRDSKMIEIIMDQNYRDIFSNSPFDIMAFSDFKAQEARLAYAKAWTNFFKMLQDNPDQKKTVFVMRHDRKTVGYIKYSISTGMFSGKPFRGNLEQLAIEHSHRGKKLGEQLCNHVLTDFSNNGIPIAEVATTTHEVGHKFYCNKLGFQYYTQVTSLIGPTTTYLWRKQLIPSVSWLSFLKK